MARFIKSETASEPQSARWFIQNADQVPLDQAASETKPAAGISRWKIASPRIRLKGKGPTATEILIAERRESLR